MKCDVSLPIGVAFNYENRFAAVTRPLPQLPCAIPAAGLDFKRSSQTGALMDCKYIKALAVVSALCFMSGFIAYRVGAFDHYFVQPPAPVEPSPEPAADPALMSGSKYIALPPAGSAPASVSPPSVMGGSKSVTLPTVILPGSKVEAIVKPTVIMPGPKSMPVIGEKK